MGVYDGVSEEGVEKRRRRWKLTDSKLQKVRNEK
jgi:hypothetical protein